MSELALATLRQFLLFTAILTPLELLFPARTSQKIARCGLRTDLFYFFLNPILIATGGGLLLTGISAMLGAIMPTQISSALQAQPWIVQLIEIIVISELSAYGLHRLGHRVGWMWRFHAVHHSNEELDWLAAHRQHALEAIWMLGAANLPVVILGFPVETVLGFVLAQKLYTAFLHANVRFDLGWIGRWLLASPRYHHWHHDGRSGASSGNFSSVFPWIDRLFGTYQLPPGFPERYGIDDPIAESYLGQLLFIAKRAPASLDCDDKSCSPARARSLS
jgi:sterol desaturase/sphingolipid hydroxylase (fatty acid hydroxylase superfamily)